MLLLPPPSLFRHLATAVVSGVWYTCYSIPISFRGLQVAKWGFSKPDWNQDTMFTCTKKPRILKKNLILSRTERQVWEWTFHRPASAKQPTEKTAITFYFCTLRRIHIRLWGFSLPFRRPACTQQTSCRPKVYEIHAVPRGWLWTHKTTPCAPSAWVWAPLRSDWRSGTCGVLSRLLCLALLREGRCLLLLTSSCLCVAALCGS